MKTIFKCSACVAIVFLAIIGIITQRSQAGNSQQKKANGELRCVSPPDTENLSKRRCEKIPRFSTGGLDNQAP